MHSLLSCVECVQFLHTSTLAGQKPHTTSVIDQYTKVINHSNTFEITIVNDILKYYRFRPMGKRNGLVFSSIQVIFLLTTPTLYTVQVLHIKFQVLSISENPNIFQNIQHVVNVSYKKTSE
jgi:hypothetical protein